MNEFASTYGFKHITISPHYPRSNELAERTVKTIKNLMYKYRPEPTIAQLLFHSSPLVQPQPFRIVDGEENKNNNITSVWATNTPMALFIRILQARWQVQEGTRGTIQLTPSCTESTRITQQYPSMGYQQLHEWAWHSSISCRNTRIIHFRN